MLWTILQITVTCIPCKPSLQAPARPPSEPRLLESLKLLRHTFLFGVTDGGMLCTAVLHSGFYSPKKKKERKEKGESQGTGYTESAISTKGLASTKHTSTMSVFFSSFFRLAEIHTDAYVYIQYYVRRIYSTVRGRLYFCGATAACAVGYVCRQPCTVYLPRPGPRGRGQEGEVRNE